MRVTSISNNTNFGKTVRVNMPAEEIHSLIHLINSKGADIEEEKLQKDAEDHILLGVNEEVALMDVKHKLSVGIVGYVRKVGFVKVKIARQRTEAEGTERSHALSVCLSPMHRCGIRDAFGPRKSDDLAANGNAVVTNGLGVGVFVGHIGHLAFRMEGKLEPIGIFAEFLAEFIRHHGEVEVFTVGGKKRSRKIVKLVKEVDVHLGTVKIVGFFIKGKIRVVEDGRIGVGMLRNVRKEQNVVVRRKAVTVYHVFHLINGNAAFGAFRAVFGDKGIAIAVYGNVRRVNTVPFGCTRTAYIDLAMRRGKYRNGKGKGARVDPAVTRVDAIAVYGKDKVDRFAFFEVVVHDRRSFFVVHGCI